MIYDLTSDRPLPVCRASQITPRTYEWLWPQRLAFGKLNMLDGDAGEGKSLLALDLCARLSTGREMPDGTPGPGVVNSLIIQDEDGGDDTVICRLKALGADCERVSIWTPRDEDEPFSLPSQLALLERMIGDTGARFIVIDPILAFLDAGVLASSEQSVRRAFRPLQRMIARLRCVIQMVRHLGKVRRTRARYHGLGTVALTNLCRSTWLVGRDPQSLDIRVLAENKNNLGPPQPSLAYRLAGVGSGATVEWLGVSPLGADDLGGRRKPSPRLEAACEFLEEFLKDGPRTPRGMRAAARKRSIASRTLNRAAKTLKAKTRQLWSNHTQCTYWLLDGQCIPTGASPDAAPDDFDRYLADIEKQRSAADCR
jgi:hypothetical protein